MKQDNTTFALGRIYFRLRANLLGLRRNGLIDANTDKVMTLEVRQAKKAYSNAGGEVTNDGF